MSALPQLKAVALAGLFLALGIIPTGCQSAAPPSPAKITAGQYWAQAEPIALAATLHLRLVNNAIRAHVEDRLSFARLQQTLGYLAPEIFDVAQRLVAVEPPVSLDPGHRLLVEALGLLVRSGQEGRAIARDADLQHVAAIAVLVPEAQTRLAQYSRLMPATPGATEVRQWTERLGTLRVVATAESAFVVTLGPFESAAATRQAIEQLAIGPAAAVPTVAPFLVQAGSFSTRREAEQAADTTRMRGVPAGVERQPTHQFRVEGDTPPSGYYWREMLWLQRLDFPAALVATAAAGDLVLVASREGAVQGWEGSGEYIWHRDLDAALVTLALAAGGDRAVLAGYESFLLSRDRTLIWRSPFSTGGQLLADARIADDGQHVTLRTAPPDGGGQIHALNVSSYLWPTLPYIGARDMALTPDGSQLAIASAKADARQLILVTVPAGQRLARFDLPVVPERVAITPTGSHAAILGNDEILLYDLVDERLVWRQAAVGSLLGFTPDGQLVVNAGHGGVVATDLSGDRIWAQEDGAPLALALSRTYVVVKTDRDRLDVFRAADGARLGAVYMPGSLLAFALARESNLLVASDTERNVAAWQLP